MAEFLSHAPQSLSMGEYFASMRSDLDFRHSRERQYCLLVVGGAILTPFFYDTGNGMKFSHLGLFKMLKIRPIAPPWFIRGPSGVLMVKPVPACVVRLAMLHLEIILYHANSS